MFTPLFLVFTSISDLAILALVGYYFLKVRTREKELAKKETKIDTEYHQVVDNALSRERKILEDATGEADQIIKNAQYSTEESQKIVADALQKMVADIHQDAVASAQNFTATYQGSLRQLSDQSISDFQGVASTLKSDLELQISQFHNSLLPALQKELEDYKQARLTHIESSINLIIQKVAQQVLNKSISLPDHTKLVVDSMEKAKKEGMFG